MYMYIYIYVYVYIYIYIYLIYKRANQFTAYTSIYIRIYMTMRVAAAVGRHAGSAGTSCRQGRGGEPYLLPLSVCVGLSIHSCASHGVHCLCKSRCPLLVRAAVEGVVIPRVFFHKCICMRMYVSARLHTRSRSRFDISRHILIALNFRHIFRAEG
jgi:hypothetical protein